MTKKNDKLVIKIGSSLLVGEDGEPRRNWLVTLVEDIAKRHSEGTSIIIVSSGSIALGSKALWQHFQIMSGSNLS